MDIFTKVYKLFIGSYTNGFVRALIEFAYAIVFFIEIHSVSGTKRDHKLFYAVDGLLFE